MLPEFSLETPEAFLKVVFFIPNALARRVMILANLRSVPPIDSASTVAISFADLVARAPIAFSTDIVSPRLNPSREGDRLSAIRETGSLCLRLRNPLFIASKVIKSVIILVSEAG